MIVQVFDFKFCYVRNWWSDSGKSWGVYGSRKKNPRFWGQVWRVFINSRLG